MRTRFKSKEDMLKAYPKEAHEVVSWLWDKNAKWTKPDKGSEVILNPSPKLLEAMRKAKQKKQENLKQGKRSLPLNPGVNPLAIKRTSRIFELRSIFKNSISLRSILRTLSFGLGQELRKGIRKLTLLMLLETRRVIRQFCFMEPQLWVQGVKRQTFLPSIL